MFVSATEEDMSYADSYLLIRRGPLDGRRIYEVWKKSSDKDRLLGCVSFVLEPKLLMVLMGEQ